MKSTTWLIGLALSVLSIVLLVKQAFTVGFVPALQIALDFYETTMTVLLGWAAPILDALMRPLGLQVMPHWKHVFLLMWIFLLHGAGNPFALGFNRVNLFVVPWALIVALGASAVAGTLPMQGGDASANFFVAAVPILAVEVFWLGGNLYALVTWPEQSAVLTWRRFMRHERDHVWHAALGTVLAGAAMLVPIIGNAQGGGLAVLVALMILYAIWLLRIAANDARHVRRPEQTLWSALMTLDRAQIGVGILGAFAGAALFVVTNAGLKLAGL